MTTTAAETRKLTKTYRRAAALSGLDLELHAGEVFGLLGPNGAGKTTAVRLLMDLIRPTSGRVALFGVELTARSSARLRRRVGYVPGDLSLYDRLTGEEFLRLCAALRGHPDLGGARRLAERLDLDLGRRAGELSKGNRQKLAVVQAFLHEPDLVLLDEPASGLDPLAQQEFLGHLREYAAAGGAVLISSHVISEVEQVADRVGILLAGKLVVDERVAELKSNAPRELTFAFAEPVDPAELGAVPGVRELRTTGAMVHCRITGPVGELVRAAAQLPLVNVTSHEPDLQGIFLDYARDQDHD